MTGILVIVAVLWLLSRRSAAPQGIEPAPLEDADLPEKVNRSRHTIVKPLQRATICDLPGARFFAECLSPTQRALLQYGFETEPLFDPFGLTALERGTAAKHLLRPL